jgi:POT family proton-dependent oligopeptide transporter
MQSGKAVAQKDKPVEASDVFGHPRGLMFIAFTEAWERFSFYGMQALLMLYLTGYLLKPGIVETVHGFPVLQEGLEAIVGELSLQAAASQIFGIYVGLIYLAPLVGGYLGDNLLGRRRAVLIGAFAMAAGHFLMAFESAFLMAITLLVIGSGLLKGNLAAQVGALYDPSDRRRDGAYTVYVTAINVGAFIAPLVCGTLGEFYGWHYGFGAAGVGMLVSIVIYLAGTRHLPEEVPISKIKRLPLSNSDVSKVLALSFLVAVTVLFWTVQTQVWNVYPLWLRDDVDRSVWAGAAVPVTWFQSLDAFAVLALAPLTIYLWRRQTARGTEPSDLSKIAWGGALFAIACIALALGQMASATEKVHIAWPVLFHFILGAGYLYFAPVTLSVISRSAPPSTNSMMVGAYYLGIFGGGAFSGWVARFYEPLQPTAFWLLHAGIAASGALIIVASGKRLAAILGQTEANGHTAA